MAEYLRTTSHLHHFPGVLDVTRRDGIAVVRDGMEVHPCLRHRGVASNGKGGERGGMAGCGGSYNDNGSAAAWQTMPGAGDEDRR